MPAPLMDRFPSISDLESRAKRRIPSFAWEYLASGTGDESLIGRNVSAMADVQFVPEFLKGPMEPVVETELFGISYAAPIGIAPIGLTGLIWPGADAGPLSGYAFGRRTATYRGGSCAITSSANFVGG